MYIRIELSKSEKMAIDSISSMFDGATSKFKTMKETNEHVTETTIIGDDGSYTSIMEVTEIFTVCVINWLRDMINSSKGLIMSAYDTYKNLKGMLGIKKLVIDDKEVNVTVPVKAKVEKNGVMIIAKKYVTQDKNKNQEKAQLTNDIEKMIDSVYHVPAE